MERIHTHNYYLTADECNPQGQLSLPRLVELVIETATEHANKLHIGYADLLQYNIGWVLSRLSVEIENWPEVNTEFEIRTWIVDCKRMYSTRAHELRDSNGHVFGRVRTVWAAIDTKRRVAADLSVLNPEVFVCPMPGVPLVEMNRIPLLGDHERKFEYKFRYSDIDVNRHVTSRRYVELIMDSHTLEWHDINAVSRFEIAFHRESLWGQEVDVLSTDIPDTSAGTVQALTELRHGEQRLTVASTIYRKRN